MGEIEMGKKDFMFMSWATVVFILTLSAVASIFNMPNQDGPKARVCYDGTDEVVVRVVNDGFFDPFIFDEPGCSKKQAGYLVMRDGRARVLDLKVPIDTKGEFYIQYGWTKEEVTAWGRKIKINFDESGFVRLFLKGKGVSSVAMQEIDMANVLGE